MDSTDLEQCIIPHLHYGRKLTPRTRGVDAIVERGDKGAAYGRTLTVDGGITISPGAIHQPAYCSRITSYYHGEGGMRRPNEEGAVSVEYLLVSYKEDRDVLADGDSVGITNSTIILQANEYIITLSGDGYEPPSQIVVVAGTSKELPKVVKFT
jgi:hypothetical protein